MRLYFYISLLISMPLFTNAQINPLFIETTPLQADSLKLFLKQNTNNDTLRMEALRDLTLHYLDFNSDSAAKYIILELPIIEKLGLKIWKADAYDLYSIVLSGRGNFAKALELINAARQIATNEDCEKNIWHISKFTNTGNARNARLSMLAAIQLDMGGLYRNTKDYDKQLIAFRESLKTASEINDLTIITIVNLNLGNLYRNRDQQDSALYYYKESIANSAKCGYRKYLSAVYNGLAEISLRRKNFNLVQQYLDSAIKLSEDYRDEKEKASYYMLMTEFFIEKGLLDSAIYYAYKGLGVIKSTGQFTNIATAYTKLSKVYRMQNKYDSAFKYLELAVTVKDSVNSAENMKRFQNIGFFEQLKLNKLEKEKILAQNRIRTYTLLGGLGMILLVALILYWNNRQKQKANKTLEETLSNLKITQSQLIQSEKMASLGELTAGIAHEIQNPLNFVNNFSEVSNELIDEMKEELAKGNYDDAKGIADDVKQNLEKINHHGKRADAIVKGMLQHSRTGSATKEPTDINKLADEYLRLAFHGLRAKDKSFNATMKTDYDESIGNINIIPQDIGRVILNLITNAFYAVDEKTKSGIDNYEPTVSVRTKNINNNVEIKVTDNGNGIPQNVIDKIFQPFFTTKPTGQGTGLGLSMSYDIVKAHGGEIKAETKNGEETEFFITLPKH